MSAVAPCSRYKVCCGRTVLQHTAAVPGARALGYAGDLLAPKGGIWGGFITGSSVTVSSALIP